MNTQNNFSIQNTVINTPNMPFYDFQDYNTLCINACMGIGKTGTLYDYIKYNMNKKILIVSFRVTLEEKYADDLPDFNIYNKIKGTIQSDVYNHLIIQIDSLYRIRGNYDLIVFDEFTYTMSHLITSCKTRTNVYDCLEQLLYNDNKMIFMDAFLDNEIVEWISKYNNRKINFIKNKYSIHDDKKIISYKHDISNFIKEIKLTLKNKQKIVIASNNKVELFNIERIIKKNYPNLKKLFISRETKEKYDIKEWNNVDVLAYTPTITAGVSFTNERFDKVFGLFCNSTSPADMSIQQLFRVRNISTKEYHLCCKTTGKRDYPLDDKKIEEYIINNEKCLVSGVKGIKLDYIKDEIKKDSYFYLYKYIQKKIFKSNNNYISYMIELLKEQGIVHFKENCLYNKEDTKKYNKEYKEYRSEMKDLECEEIVNRPLINDEEAKEKRKDHNKNNEDIQILKKHDFLNITKIANNLLNKDIYKKYHHHTSKLYNLCQIKTFDDIYDTFNKRLNIYIKKSKEEKNIKRLHLPKKLEKRIFANDIITELGFKNVFDINQINLDRNKVINYIKSNHKELELLFTTNLHDWDNIIKNDTKYFSKIMRYLNDRIYSIFKVRIVENKKTKKHYIKGLDFWDDNSVTYKNPILIEHIKQKEEDFIQNDAAEEFINKFILDNNITGLNDVPVEHHPDYIPPTDYTNMYKYKSQNLCDLCNIQEPCRWLVEEGINYCEDCHWQ